MGVRNFVRSIGSYAAVLRTGCPGERHFQLLDRRQRPPRFFFEQCRIAGKFGCLESCSKPPQFIDVLNLNSASPQLAEQRQDVLRNVVGLAIEVAGYINIVDPNSGRLL